MGSRCRPAAGSTGRWAGCSQYASSQLHCVKCNSSNACGCITCCLRSTTRHWGSSGEGGTLSCWSGERRRAGTRHAGCPRPGDGPDHPPTCTRWQKAGGTGVKRRKQRASETGCKPELPAQLLYPWMSCQDRYERVRTWIVAEALLQPPLGSLPAYRRTHAAPSSSARSQGTSAVHLTIAIVNHQFQG